MNTARLGFALKYAFLMSMKDIRNGFMTPLESALILSVAYMEKRVFFDSNGGVLAKKSIFSALC